MVMSVVTSAVMLLVAVMLDASFMSRFPTSKTTSTGSISALSFIWSVPPTVISTVLTPSILVSSFIVMSFVMSMVTLFPDFIMLVRLIKRLPSTVTRALFAMASMKDALSKVMSLPTSMSTSFPAWM